VVSSIFFFSLPNLNRCRLDVYHTSTHGVALVQVYDAGLKRAACGSLKIHDAKWPKIHYPGTVAQLYQAISSQLSYILTIRKNLLNSNTSPSCPHNMVNFGPLTAEIMAISSQLSYILTIRKNLLNSNTSPSCPHNTVNFGPLTAEIISLVGAPQLISTVSCLGSIIARRSSSGRQPNFVVLNWGHQLHSAGWLSRVALSHILVIV